MLHVSCFVYQVLDEINCICYQNLVIFREYLILLKNDGCLRFVNLITYV